MIPNEYGKLTTPSCVAFTDSRILVGETGKNETKLNPTNAIYDTKRLIGRYWNDSLIQKSKIEYWPFVVVHVNGYPKIEVNYKGKIKRFFPEEIASIILNNIKESAEAYLNQTVTDAVITVPAIFNGSQRQAIIDAGSIAGLNVLGLINEPTAAAVAYDFQNKSMLRRNVLIFDFGGGKCDVSIVTIHCGHFTVISTAGNAELGGNDLNAHLVEILVHEFECKHNISLKCNKRALHRLNVACEHLKCELSTLNEVRMEIDRLIDTIDYGCLVNRDSFNRINDEIFRTAMDLVQKALDDANMHKTSIDEIVLVGGSSRIPEMQLRLQKFFNGKRINTSMLEIEASAYGAAIKATILQGNSSLKMQMSDIMSFPIGFDANDGFMSILFGANTRIPIEKIQTFNVHRYQQTVTIGLLESDPNKGDLINILGDFELRRDPVRCTPIIEIKFHVDANGILSLTSLQRTANREISSAILIKRRFTEMEIEYMYQEAEMIRLEIKAFTNATAMDELRSAVNRMTLMLDDKRQNITTFDRFTISEKCIQINEWLKCNPSAAAERCIYLRTKFETFCKPILKYNDESKS